MANSNVLKHKIAIIMGSNSDHGTLKLTENILKDFDINFTSHIVSAHRTPEKMFEFAKKAKSKGYSAIIAAAGGAAHLPGMVASLTTLPVIGVPISTNELNGLDSLLSINQMPSGVPVATMAVGKAGAENAALFVIRLVSLSDKVVEKKLKAFIKNQEDKVLATKLGS